jgi:mxaJ protein
VTARGWWSAVLAAMIVTAVPGAPGAPAPAPRNARVLRVAADPNNLPFSNDRGEGFENAIVALVARDLGMRVTYVWRAQRRGFFRETLGARGDCDLVAGVPLGFERALATVPYYRSSYVFVTRADRRLAIRSLDDPVLRRMRIGVQLIDGQSASPPAHALARRGLTSRLVGFTLYGDYRRPHPPERILHAVADGEVDVAIVWGPLAGYFASREPVALAIATVPDDVSRPDTPMAFDIAMGVRPGDTALRRAVSDVLVRRRAEVDHILDRYGVPRAAAATASSVR